MNRFLPRKRKCPRLIDVFVFFSLSANEVLKTKRINSPSTEAVIKSRERRQLYGNNSIQVANMYSFSSDNNDIEKLTFGFRRNCLFSNTVGRLVAYKTVRYESAFCGSVGTRLFQDDHKYYTSLFVEDGGHLWTDLRYRAGSVRDDYLSSSNLAIKVIQLPFEFPFYGHYVTNATLTTGGTTFKG